MLIELVLGKHPHIIVKNSSSYCKKRNNVALKKWVLVLTKVTSYLIVSLSKIQFINNRLP